MILRDRVVRLRAPLVQAGYGNQKRDWTAAEAVLYPAAVGPLGTDEDVVDQQRTTTRWRLFLPAGADMVATDRIAWDGITYEVDGDVQAHKRRGRIHHHEAVLIAVTQR